VRPKLSAISAFLTLLFLSVGSLHAQERTVRGTVVEQGTQAPVASATVTVQGTDIGAISDERGGFVLRGVPDREVTLLVQRIGFTRLEHRLAADQNRVTLTLTTDYLRLEELVVTGRATQTQRRNAATAVASVTGEEVDKTAQESIDKALQGRVAGATISNNSGAPGGGSQVQLRGPSSVFARSNPLYVIDGVLVSDDAVSPNANAITSASTGSNPSLDQDNQQNRIADLNPQDIESIEILKGPAAAAIYGSKAANGVIVIETRRGGGGAPSWRIMGRGGVPDNSEKIGSRVFETRQEAVDAFGEFAGEIWDEASQAQGGGVPFFDNEQALADRNDLSWEGSLSVSGGTEDGIQYFGSAFSKDESGIVENTGFEKQSGRVNLTTGILDGGSFSLNSNLIRTRSQRGLTNNDNSQTSYYMVLTATPSFMDLSKRPDGSFPFNPFAGGGSNPLQTAELLDKQEEVFRMLGSTNVDLPLVQNESGSVRLVATAGIDWFNQDNDIFSPPALFFEDNDGLLGTKVVNNANNLQWNTNVNAVWDFTPGGGGTTFTTSTGFQFEFSELESENTVGQNLTGGKDKVDAATVVSIRQDQQKTEDFGFYIQEQVLTLDERLQITGALRFDQSSANADNDELFIFPHASVSYRLPELGGFGDELKLRAAFGQTGNRPLFGQEFTSLRLTENIEGIPGFTIIGDVADADLEPERQTEIEWGFDLTGFDGRARLEATGYWQFINDLILQRTLAPSSGFDTKLFNGGELQNKGAEISLDGRPIVKGDFAWSGRINFSLNRNKLTDLPVTSFTQGSFGETLGTFCVGEGESLNDIVGTDPTLTAETAGQCGLQKLGEATPDFELNFTHTFDWKGFSLYQLWDWRPGFEVINLTELLADAFGVSEDFEDEDGVISPVNECFPDCSGTERIVGFANGFARGYTQAASFIKLREVSLTWDLPEHLRQALWSGFDNVQFSFSGRELFTGTPYRGLDPEVSNFGRENFARNVDVAPFPPSRSFWFTTQVAF